MPNDAADILNSKTHAIFMDDDGNYKPHCLMHFQKLGAAPVESNQTIAPVVIRKPMRMLARYFDMARESISTHFKHLATTAWSVLPMKDLKGNDITYAQEKLLESIARLALAERVSTCTRNVSINTHILPRKKSDLCECNEPSLRERFSNKTGEKQADWIQRDVYVIAPENKMKAIESMLFNASLQHREGFAVPSAGGFDFSEAVARSFLTSAQQKKLDGEQVVAWWEIKEDFFITLDKTMFERVKAAINIQDARPQITPKAANPMGMAAPVGH